MLSNYNIQNTDSARQLIFLTQRQSKGRGLRSGPKASACEIDIKDKLKEKLGVDFRNYVILGACNPQLAFKTLQQEINIGLLLPCNVIVYEADEPGKSVVGAINAKTMLSVVGDNSTLNAVAVEVNENLKRVVAQL